MTDKDPFDGFEQAIRTFWFDGEDLKVFQGWGRDVFTDKFDQSIKTSIRGIGFSEKDSIKIIGTDIRTREFDLNIGIDDNVSETWKYISSNELTRDSSDSVVTRRFEHIKKRCDEKPPTASLSYNEADIEIGIKSGWWAEISIPSFLMKKLENDVRQGIVSKIHVGVEWIHGLVFDYHAPPAMSNTWGLIQENEKRSPEILKGYVVSVGWNVSNQPYVDPKNNNEIEPDLSKCSVKSYDDVIVSLTNSILSLSREMKIGFTITSILIILVYLLR